MNPEQLQTELQALVPQIVAWRRHLHMHPEPSFKEFETMAFVSSALTTYGISHQKGVAGTGVVAHIAASAHDPQTPCLALRADLDALPIQEQNEVPYKSQVPGWMHACGHDVHTSILLATAVLLQANKESLKRPVKLIFQPGEEQNPGGASLLIEAGVLENPRVEELVALHVYPELTVGKIGLKEGLYMASSDEIHVEIEGVGGHGALPDRFINPIDVGMAWMQACKQFVDENCPSSVPQVLTFGRFEALGSTNVVSSTASIKGTFRTMDETWRATVKSALQAKASEVAAQFGAKIIVTIGEGYPFLMNDPALTQKVQGILTDTLGAAQIETLGLRMTAEDFAFYSHHRPVCFFRLGTGFADKASNPAVHHPQFDIDENALEVGVRCMLAIALS
ncbi:MAG: M20 family metallopeptidase [Crocinitomicaceae bacterium]|nr:M20 family metallopeptidase [Crocinitomicaceae bacterium]MDP4954742.1 M20 family metallopeptidase [Crocinitomicaceae bacterium]MDP5067118.1 M20 family metallopeptidase [Crocinitomicaceae bacterium]